MDKLMNEQSKWDHRILATVKEGPADCIRIDEVAAALKQMKSWNSLYFSSVASVHLHQDISTLLPLLYL